MAKKIPKSKLLEGLNSDQVQAVTTTQGPLLIIAGAGTGKTTVIARRIAYLIDQDLAKPSEILALTFTDKAANEMEERVDQLMPYGSFDTTIATFHSFGETILRECALEIGLPSDFSILTRPQQVLFFQQNLFRFELKHYRPLSTPTKFIQALISFISRCKDECISPEDYQNYVKDLALHPGGVASKMLQDFDPQEVARQEELARVYYQYEQFKSQAGLVDFGDLITKSLDCLNKQKSLLDHYQKRFKYILVDEFQDTNFAQNELVKLLVEKYHNITVVADDDQSIYRFRGAAISNVLSFMDTYQDAKQVVLITNYRSTQPILDGAYRLIQHNNPDRLEVKNNIVKKLEAAKGNAGFPLQTIFAPTLVEEVDSVVGEIERLTKSDRNQESGIRNLAKKGTKTDSRLRGNDKPLLQPTTYPLQPSFDEPIKFKDIAILVRANSHAQPFLQALAAKGIPYAFSGTSGLYETPEVRNLLSFLTVITNFYDNLQLYNLAISPSYDLPMEDLIKLMEFSSKKSKPLYWALEQVESLASIIGIREENVEQFSTLYTDIITYGELTKKENVGHVLYQYLQDKGILAILKDATTVEAATQAGNIAKFFDKIAEFSKTSSEQSAKAFVDYITVLREAGDDPGTAAIDIDLDAVNVLTVHGAKGLEYKVVFLVNTVADRFPSRERAEAIPLPIELITETLPEGDFHFQEERRLFYVAVTRAADLLYITWARDYGGKRLRKTSPFAIETLGQANIPEAMVASTTTKKLEQLNLFYAPPVKSSLKQAKNQLTFVLDDDRLLSLNQSQVEDYLSCPLKYKYASILRIPLARNHLFVYGASVHKAIEHFYRAKMAHTTLPLAQLLEIFEHTWVDEGFLSEEHEQKRFAQGKLTLERFWEREKDSSTIPQAIEKPFRINVTDTIRLIGRMDRIDTDGTSVHIIDFKTTENIDDAKALKRAKDSKQLAIYALMYYKMFGSLPAKLSLYFVEEGIWGTIVPTAKTIAAAEEYIMTAASGIKAGKFEAHPDYLACTYCPYSPICPYTAAKS